LVEKIKLLQQKLLSSRNYHGRLSVVAWVFYNRKHQRLLKQESWAIAKMTARCGLCMGWVPWKFSGVP